MKEEQTDLTVTNEPSPLPQLPLFMHLRLLPQPKSLLCFCSLFSSWTHATSLILSHLQSSFPHLSFYCVIFLHFFVLSLLTLCSPLTIIFPTLSVFFFCVTALQESETLCIKRQLSTLLLGGLLLVFLIDRLILKHHNYFPACVSFYRCSKHNIKCQKLFCSYQNFCCIWVELS